MNIIFMYWWKYINYITDITLQGFNTAIVNNGYLTAEKCCFKENKLDYWFCEDCGGAIKNYGYVDIKDNSFIGNYAKYGEAIWSDSGSSLILHDNEFEGNTAYAWFDGGNEIWVASDLKEYYNDEDWGDWSDYDYHPKPIDPLHPTPGPMFWLKIRFD